MSRYLVRVQGLGDIPPEYLMLGRTTKRQENATRYPHPSNACQAEAAFRKKHTHYLCATSVIDDRTGECIGAVVDVRMHREVKSKPQQEIK